jgi:hypothetical protein
MSAPTASPRVWMFLMITLVAISLHASAQSLPARIPETVPGRPVTTAHPQQPHQPPCWEVAGISKSAMEQRQAIQRRTRSEVEAVCADPSLSQHQRQQKIREIHEQAKQELDALVPPQQMEALKSCQQARNHGGSHPGPGHPSANAGHGPCGEMTPTPAPNPPPASKPTPESEN